MTTTARNIEMSGKIEILANEKFSYIEQLPDVIDKEDLSVRSAVEIQKLLGTSAKLTRYADTLLKRAVLKNDTNAVEKAISKGANPNLKDENGDPVLISAIRKKNLYLVKTLIECKANPDTTAADGDTALITAIKNNALEITKFLVKNRANINAVNANQETPLMAAIIAGDPVILEFLLANDADLKAKDKRGWTAKKWAAKRNSKECMAVIKEYSKGLHPAVYIAIIILILAGAAAAYYFMLK